MTRARRLAVAVTGIAAAAWLWLSTRSAGQGATVVTLDRDGAARLVPVAHPMSLQLEAGPASLVDGDQVAGRLVDALASLFPTTRSTATRSTATRSTASGARVSALPEPRELPRVELQPTPATDPLREYLPAFAAAERRHGLPAGLLRAVAWRESRGRRDIIDGRTVSSAGAVGLMQIVPRWHPDARPLDPYHSIDYAAGYLADLHAMLGTWRAAVAAYNWGPTHVRRQGLDAMPAETRAYLAEVGAAVPAVAVA